MGRKSPSASVLLERIKKAEDFQNHDNWKRNSERLLSYLVGDYGQQMYSTRYIINTIYDLINLIIPNLYFQDPHIIVHPTRPFYYRKVGDKKLQIDGWERAEFVSSVLNDEIKEMGYKQEVRKVIQDVLLTGIGVMKVGRAGTSLHDADIEYLDDGDIFAQRLCMFDYLHDPMAVEPKNCRYEVHRYIETLENVRANKMLRGTADLEGMSLPEGPKKRKKEDSKNSDKWVVLYEYHDHEDDKVKILTKDNGKRKRLLYSEDKKYEFKGSDFCVLRFTSDNDTFKGISPLMMVEDEALAKNEILTLMVNHLQKFAGIILYEEGALDEDDLQRFEYGQQGDILQTQNGALREGRVKRESPLSMGADYYNNINMLNASIDRTLAIPDFQRSMPSGKRKTALEVNISAGDAQNRRGYYISFVKDFVINSVSKITSLMGQFYDKERWINMYGDKHEWVEWTKEDLKGEYVFDFDIEDIKAYSSSKAQAMIQAIQIMGPMEIFKPVWQTIDPFKLARAIFKNMDLDLKSVEKGEHLSHYTHDPYNENDIVFNEGKRVVDPFPMEDHPYHIEAHSKAILENAENKEGAEEMKRHVQMHMYWQQMANPQIQPQQPQQPNAEVKSSPEVEGGFKYNEDLRGKM